MLNHLRHDVRVSLACAVNVEESRDDELRPLAYVVAWLRADLVTAALVLVAGCALIGSKRGINGLLVTAGGVLALIRKFRSKTFTSPDDVSPVSMPQ